VVGGETATGMESIADEPSASPVRKYLKDGVLVIEKDGVKYNAMGQEIE
jgi:hypothetical protein